MSISLTAMQAGIYYDQLREPSSPRYNVGTVLKTNHHVDPSTLAQAIELLRRKMDILNVKFTSNDSGNVVQEFGANNGVKFSVVDLSNIDNAEQVATTQIESDYKKAFNILTDQLLVVTLYKIAATKHWIVIKSHHILLDGFGVALLVRHIWPAYQQAMTGQDSGGLDEIFRFEEEVLSDISYLSSEKYNQDEKFWLSKLDPLPPLVFEDFSLSKTGAYIKSHHVRVNLNSDTANKLRDFEQKNKTSFQHLGIAALVTYFHHTYNRSDLLVGVPVHRRKTYRQKRTAGTMAGDIPCRFSCEKSLTLPDLIEGITRELRANYRHTAYPQSHLARKLNQTLVERGELFDVVFNYEKCGDGYLFNDEEFDIDYLFHGAEPTTLHVRIIDFDEAQPLGIYVSAHEALMNEQEATFLAERIKYILEQFAEATDATTVGQIKVLPAQETKLLLNDFAGKRKVYQGPSTLNQCFQRQLAMCSTRIAASHQGKTISYQDLDVLVSKLAAELQKKQVKNGQIVAVHATRGIPFLACILAILRIGAIYVPLDPKNPGERINYMLHDADPFAIFIEDHLRAGLPEKYSERLISLKLLDSPSAHPSAECAGESSPQDPAYLIYTSGSTGQPKGAMVHHAGAVHHINAMFDVLGLLQNDGNYLPLNMLQSAAASSDISVWQFLAPVLSGGTTVILDDMSDMQALVETIRQSNVHLIECVPVVIRLLVDYLSANNMSSKDLPGLRWVMATGDTLSVPLVNDYLKLFPNVPLINAYGPSETSDDVCIEIIQDPLPTDQLSVSIGRPISNTSIYILGQEQQLLPIGVVGELCIAGDSVGLGYWKNPEKTAEKFIPDPFSEKSPTAQKFMYRSGDLAKWTSDGRLEFIGRTDNQVKIRGHRIELGDVEACFAAHPKVADFVALAKPVEEGELSLVSFFTVKANSSLPPQDLREFGKNKLPEYMIPSSFTQLEAMPRNAADKIDRNKLKKYEIKRHEDQSSPADNKMASEIECWLLDLWTKLLNVARADISEESNFFAVGGQSLLSVRLVSAIKEKWKIDIQIRHIFSMPTFGKQVAFIENGKAKAALAIGIAPQAQSYPLSYAQQRIWFIDQFQPGGSEYNASVEINLNGKLNVAALELALKDVVQRHSALRTVYISEGDDARQQITATPDQILEVVDLRQYQSPLQEQAICEARHRNQIAPFSLEKDLMLRVLLIRRADEAWTLMMTVHHIASDGWSQGLLARDLAELYSLHDSGAPIRLATLPIEYKDYAHWQRTWLREENLRPHVNYWKNHLQGLPSVHNFPLDFARPAKESHAGGLLQTYISKADLKNMYALMATQEITLFMLLMAVFSSVIHRYSGDSDVVIGSPVANREQSEVANLVGFFVNTLVFRNSFDGDITFEELLKQCKQNAINAYSHQQMPFEMLVDVLQPVRSSSYNPLFQIMLTLENNAIGDWALPGVEAELVQPESAASQFDLSLDVLENEQGLVLTWNYATDLFEKSTISRLAQHFSQFLITASAQPDEKIHQIGFLTPSERQQLLHDFNSNHQPQFIEKTWPELFFMQSQKSPEAIAARCGNEIISYKNLEARSRHMAHVLQKKMADPGGIVAILAERNIQFLVSMVAILRAGAAYLPIDPKYPVARIKLVLQETKPDLLLLDSEDVREELLDVCKAEKACIIEELLAQEENQEEFFSSPLGYPKCEDLAYVIFTSGSTGTPKGVMVEHQGMINNMLAKMEPLQLHCDDVIGQTASQSFDISVWQFLTALLIGARSDIVPAHIAQDPDALLDYVAEHEITIWEPVPSMIRAVLEQPRALPKLRFVLPTGEALTKELAKQWFAIYPGVPLCNVYGPAECSDDVTFEKIENAHFDRVWIGTPVPNARVHILDANRQLVPVGVIGEIAISGMVVGKGYLHRPDLTQAVFIDNPYCQDALDTRLYLTGDLGRRGAHGKIEYIGRKDHQVKLRGLRIELGEIESHLRKCEGIHDAAVIAHELSASQVQLLAFVVSDASEDVRLAAVKELSKHLPSYMLPDRYIMLPKIPLNMNGKIDRNQLKTLIVPDQKAAQPVSTGTEIALVEIWAALLKIESDTLFKDSDFFACGGHSLLIVRLVSAIKQKFNLQLSMQDVFEYSELSEMAAQLDFLNKQQTLANALASVDSDNLEEIEF